MRQLNVSVFIDSSAGDAHLSAQLKQLIPCSVYNYDTHPSPNRQDKIIKQDFLHVRPMQIPVVIGFNPPFGRAGVTATAFLIRSTREWAARGVVFIVPYAASQKMIPNYQLMHRSQLPPGSFFRPDTPQKHFDHPAFIVVYKRETQRTPRNTPPARPVPPSLLRIRQYQNDMQDIETNCPCILVRRIGANCGKHGYLYFPSPVHKWVPYRFGKLQTDGDLTSRPPHLTPGAFFLVILRPTTTKPGSLITLIQRIARLRESRSYKRTLSTQDILDSFPIPTITCGGQRR
jgi:hypothetical protein